MMTITRVEDLLSNIFNILDYVGKPDKNAKQFCSKGFRGGPTVIDQVCDIIILCQNV